MVLSNQNIPQTSQCERHIRDASGTLSHVAGMGTRHEEIPNTPINSGTVRDRVWFAPGAFVREGRSGGTAVHTAGTAVHTAGAAVRATGSAGCAGDRSQLGIRRSRDAGGRGSARPAPPPSGA